MLDIFGVIVVLSLFSKLMFSKQKKNTGTRSECQTVWIKIRTNVMLSKDDKRRRKQGKSKLNFTVKLTDFLSFAGY